MLSSYLNRTLHVLTCRIRTAKVHYVTSLSNVDWLHGASESLLMLTNLFIVFGLKDALRKAEDVNSRLEQEEKPSM